MLKLIVEFPSLFNIVILTLEWRGNVWLALEVVVPLECEFSKLIHCDGILLTVKCYLLSKILLNL